MFGNRDGFDAVIGNPPYVQLQKDGGKLGRLYKDSGYETFARTGDVYLLVLRKRTGITKTEYRPSLLYHIQSVDAGQQRTTFENGDRKTKSFAAHQPWR